MQSAAPSVPVTMGSPAFRSLTLDGFEVIEAWFPPHATLQCHTHDRACVAVMLEGSFDLHIGGQVHECPPTTVAIEPGEERHANRIGSAGARLVVVQPDPAREELCRPFREVLERIGSRLHPGVTRGAHQLARELDLPDDLAQLAAESIVLEMLVELTRAERSGTRRPPAWLRRAQEMLHARFAGPVRSSDIAREVGVHPAHLARAFRQHFHSSVGSYVRRLRLDWAAEELSRRETPLAEVALAAGFADQSHFTRSFRRYAGLTPNAYRSTRRR
ncbi:MAG TPA: AraC family transcriptional regulator [Gemmatimonadales bacterium]|nr:AraC family transcriptional regulator [Gemmatimonadales bacterium]